MVDPPVVSVIIPNYNHARFLKQRIDSVLNQTFQDFELILLDDASSDASREIIQTYSGNPKITHIVLNKTNSGNTFNQWRQGLQLAKGSYIWIAESDDYADDRLLQTLVNLFFLHEDLLLCYCQSAIVDDENHFIRLLDWADALNDTKWKTDYINDALSETKDFLSFRNTIPNASAVVFKKPADLGILNESSEMKLAGDWLFWRKLLNADGKIAFFAKPYNYFRLHAGTTRAATTKEKELLRMKEQKKMIVPALLSPLNNRYDWMLDLWFQNRKVFRGSKDYFIPRLPAVLLIRLCFMYFRNVARKRFQKD